MTRETGSWSGISEERGGLRGGLGSGGGHLGTEWTGCGRIGALVAQSVVLKAGLRTGSGASQWGTAASDALEAARKDDGGEDGLRDVGAVDDCDGLEAAAAGALADVDGKDAGEEVLPRHSGRAARGDGVAGSGVGRAVGRCGNDLGAHGRVGAEDAVVAQEVEARRGHEGGDAGDDGMRLEDEGADAALSRALELDGNAAVVEQAEAVVWHGWTAEIAA